MDTYNHREIERKWQERWRTDALYKTDINTEKDTYYLLIEFPYPSGNLHIGHWYAFSVPDIYARMLRMQGKEVLFPIGFDAFGLPAENAAIKHGLNPKDWTEQNIAHMKTQLASMGATYDWDRVVVTSDPQYYCWTQWLFLKFYENGLAYKKQSAVNWCNSCQTVLANEQVIDGTCERCGTAVEKRDLDQWFFKIRQYAERLIEDLEDLPWPEEIKESQRNWIGKSAGATFSFKTKTDTDIPVFTTRPETLFGVTYVVLAPEHPQISQLLEHAKNREEVSTYITETSRKSDLSRQQSKEKTGIEISGVTVTHPATGASLPVWVADYVLPQYGTGAVMAVPAHDERDQEFARAHSLPVHQILDDDGRLIDSDDFSGMQADEAAEKITEAYGEKKVMYKLRDWLLSRQRYWGCPIPIVYDPDGNPHPVPEEHLPWMLPEDVDHTPTGEAPLARSRELAKRTEEIFGAGWKPEVDTMDVFVDSSWYFLRYFDPENEEAFCDPEVAEHWMPVDRYSGGAEHTTMHLLYSRFFYKALHDMGLVPTREPYQERLNRSLILGPDGNKMSKSKGNVVDPDEHVARVGSDTIRMYLAFVGPYNEVGTYPWDLGGVAGIRRFLERVWRLREQAESETDTDAVTTALHQTIKKVGDDIASFKFNTAISQLMVLVNTIEEEGALTKESYRVLLQLLAPFAPHLCEEVWEQIGGEYSIHTRAWPQYDPGKLTADTAVIAIQVNGKVRATITVATDAQEALVREQAEEQENVQKYLQGVTVQKVVYVPGKLINFVVS